MPSKPPKVPAATSPLTMAAFPNRSLSDLRSRKITANYVGSYRSAAAERLARRLISDSGVKQLPGQTCTHASHTAPKSRLAKRLIVCSLSAAEVIFYVSRTALPKPRATAAKPLGTDAGEHEHARRQLLLVSNCQLLQLVQAARATNPAQAAFSFQLTNASQPKDLLCRTVPGGCGSEEWPRTPDSSHTQATIDSIRVLRGSGLCAAL